MAAPTTREQPMFELYMPTYESVPVIRCSPPSWMIHMALVEKGLDHQCHQLDFAKGEHQTDVIKALNPRGTIPILKHRDAVVFETLAILEYIEFACPVPSLLPHDLVARATALTRLHESGMLKDCGMTLFAWLMRTPLDAHTADEMDQRLAPFLNELARWNVYLEHSGGMGVAGELSLADLAVFSYLETARWLGVTFEGTSLGHFMDWMRARPSVQTTWPDAWTRDHQTQPLHGVVWS